MTDLSISNQIAKLVELQKVDKEIFDLNKDLDEKPTIIKELEQVFESKKEKLKGLEDKLKNIQVARKDIELDLKSKEENISKANVQLSQLKTNKEYSAKISEIESMKADKSVAEEKILLSYDESDAVRKEIEEEKKNVQEQEKVFLTKKKEVEDELKSIEDRIKVLDSQRKQIIPEVDPKCLARYEKILKHKNGLAIVPVKGNSCGGCFMNVPPQVVNVVKMSNEIIACEMCNRILYLEESD